MTQNVFTSRLSRLICLPALLVLGTVSCQPPADWEEAAEEESVRVEPPELTTVEVEIRDDGLAYEAGNDTPFTGEVVLEDIEARDVHDKPDRRIRIPYKDGLIHGVQVRYFPSGNVVEERTFEMGVPKKLVGYWSNGQRKLEVPLNANNQAEGPYRRWFRNGQLQSEGTYNENERFHGESREYNEEGELIGRYIWDNQRIVEVVFESPEQEERRLLHYGELTIE